MKAELTLSIISAILIHGPQAVIKISNAMQATPPDKLSPEDIENLFITKDPGEYFDER
jgi:hypothetical protein